MKNILWSITPSTLKKGFWVRPGRPVRNAGFWQTSAKSSRSMVPVTFQEEAVSLRVTVVREKPTPRKRTTWADLKFVATPMDYTIPKPVKPRDGWDLGAVFQELEEPATPQGCPSLAKVAKTAAEKVTKVIQPTPRVQPSGNSELARIAREAAAKLATKVVAPMVTPAAPIVPVVTAPARNKSVAPPKSTTPKPVKLASFADLARLRW